MGPVHAAGAMLNSRLLAASCWAVALICLAPIGWAGEGKNATDIHRREVLREEATFRVHGLTEKWRLVWAELPRPICDADDITWITSPCTGFAYGEYGRLLLTRTVEGTKAERMELAPLFTGPWDEPGSNLGAILRRWEPRKGDPYDPPEPVDLSKIHSRPVAKAMRFADYNHDDNATEFLLQVGVMAGGRRLGVLVGVSPRHPTLHAFGTAEHPDRPLVLQFWEWDKILNSSDRTVTMTDWPCDDHGSKFRQEYSVRTDAGGEFHVVKRQFSCPNDGQQEKLLFEETE